MNANSLLLNGHLGPNLTLIKEKDELDWLYLENMYVAVEDMEALVEILLEKTSLKTLSFWNFTIIAHIEIVQHYFSFLIENIPSLETLKIYMSSEEYPSSILRSIAASVGKSQLKYFELSGMKIDRQTVSDIVNSIKTNNNLREFALDFHGLDDIETRECIKQLDLKHNHTLTHLNLSGNNFSDECMGEILDILKWNYRITYIDVTHCDFLEGYSILDFISNYPFIDIFSEYTTYGHGTAAKHIMKRRKRSYLTFSWCITKILKGRGFLSWFKKMVWYALRNSKMNQREKEEREALLDQIFIE